MKEDVVLKGKRNQLYFEKGPFPISKVTLVKLVPVLIHSEVLVAVVLT